MIQIPELPTEMPHVKMRHYVITYNTKDIPGLYAVRKHLIFAGDTRPAELIGTAKTLNEARKLVPTGMHCLERDPSDDKVIVEVWL